MTKSPTHSKRTGASVVMAGPGASSPWPYDRPPDAERWQQEFNSRRLPQAAGAALCLGRLAAAEGRMQDAAVYLTRAIEFNVESVVCRAHFQLVAVFDALGRNTESELALEAAHATSDPQQTADVSVEVAAVLSSRGLYERAIEILRSVVEGWQPGDTSETSDVGDLMRAVAALRLGVLYEQAKRLADAVHAWNLALDSNYPAVTPLAALRLAELYLKDEDSHPPRVIEELLRVATDFDHPAASPRAAYLRAEFLVRHRQVGAARDIYQMLIDSGGDLADAANARKNELPAVRKVKPVRPVPPTTDRVKPVLIVGAGTGGRYLLRDLSKRVQVVGFVDDLLSVKEVQGIPVLGDIDDLDELLAQMDKLYAVLIAIPTMSGARRRVAVEACLRHGVRVENLPSMFELDVRSNLARQIRAVRVEELLGESLMFVDRAAGDLVRGRNVLIAGAGSTIGRELARQTAHARARLLALTDVSDAHLLSVLRELRRDRGYERAVGVVGGFDRPSTVERVLSLYQPEVVFHAASRDHMELMEENAVESVRTNTLALYDLARACGEAGVQRFVLVSNHHAASLRGVMDTSKLLGEHAVDTLREQFPSTDFVTIRVGNLYRAANSVVRIFDEQIDRGGPVTVASGAKRRFMRIELAAQRILQVADSSPGGGRFALTAGDTVSIHDLADLIIRLRGYTPGTDIEIRSVAPPHPERETVEPLARHERRAPTDASEVLQVVGPEPDRVFLDHLLGQLRASVEADNPQRVTQLILEARSTLKAGAPAMA